MDVLLGLFRLYKFKPCMGFVFEMAGYLALNVR